jgi:hypothetical protein
MNLPLLLTIAIVGPSRVRALTGHILQNTQFDSSGQFVGRTQMILGLLHKTKGRRALAIEHLAHGERYCALAAGERQLAGAIFNFGKERKKRYAARIGDRTLLDPSISMGGIENKSGNVTRLAGILER